MAHRLFGHEVPLQQVQMPRLSVEAPAKYMQNLIPRLTQTIKDIDELQFRIGWGAQEGMMDNWSSLLTAYSILLTRIQAISTSFTHAAIIAKPQESVPAPDAEGSSSTTAVPPAPVPLSRILLHPRLPQTTDTTEFLTMIALTTQQPFPAVKQAQEELIKSTFSGDQEGNDGQADVIRGKDEEELEQMLAGLKERLEKESNRASLVADYIRGLEDDYQWQGRIDDDDEEEEGAEEAKEGTAGKPVAVDMDVDMQDGDAPLRGDRRAKWTLDEWVRYRETGKEPNA